MNARSFRSEVDARWTELREDALVRGRRLADAARDEALGFLAEAVRSGSELAGDRGLPALKPRRKRQLGRLAAFALLAAGAAAVVFLLREGD